MSGKKIDDMANDATGGVHAFEINLHLHDFPLHDFYLSDCFFFIWFGSGKVETKTGAYSEG